MPAPAPTKWSFEADYLQACNCDYGCPCEFEAPPTQGNCQGLGLYRISRGQYGDVPLDGLGLAFVISFPQAMHLGNGTGGWVIDDRANPKQREALTTILSGKAGGMPFELFPQLLTKFMDVQFVPFSFHFDGRNSSGRAGDAVVVAVEPIKNPVTGEAEDIRIEHGTGFIFKSADCVSARESRAKTPLINFDWPNKAGFVSKVKYGN
jgi:hypothetical protein